MVVGAPVGAQTGWIQPGNPYGTAALGTPHNPAYVWTENGWAGTIQAYGNGAPGTASNPYVYTPTFPQDVPSIRPEPAPLFDGYWGR